MKKWICTVCGYVYEGETPPEFCPQCKAPASKFKEQVSGERTWAAEHVVGVAKGVDPEILQGLRDNFNGECSEVGMYLARGTLKLAFTGKRPPMRKPSTPQNLPSCWVKF